MGPATLSTSVTIPGQADTTADSNLSFLQGHTVCPSSKLLTVQQGGLNEPWQQWS